MCIHFCFFRKENKQKDGMNTKEKEKITRKLACHQKKIELCQMLEQHIKDIYNRM